MPCISCRSIFDSKVNLHVAKGVRKSNRFTFFLLCFQHLSLKHSPELLQVCYCFFSCCCFCCFLWAMASSVFYHKSCPILSYKLELHEFLLVRQERTSRGRVLFLTPCNAIDLWPSNLVYYPLLSLSLSLTYSLSFSLCVFSCWCRDWQLLAVCCKWSCYPRLLARLSTNDWGQFLMSAELVCSLPQLASVCPPFCVSVSLLCSVFLFAVPPVIAGNFA